MRKNRLVFCALLCATVFAAGCSSKTPEPSANVAQEFSHPTSETAAQTADDNKIRLDNFKKWHPERFVNGQIVAPGTQSAPLPAGAAPPASAYVPANSNTGAPTTQ